MYFTWINASFHPSHYDNAANVILLRKRLDVDHDCVVLYYLPVSQFIMRTVLLIFPFVIF